MLESAREEHRTPALAIVTSELEVVLLPRHACHDVGDPTPRIEAVMQQPKLRLARLKGKEAEGGAEEAGAVVGHARRFNRRFHGLMPGIRPRRRTR